MDEAQELVDAFFLKINTYGSGFGKTQQTTGIGHLVSILPSAPHSRNRGGCNKPRYFYGSGNDGTP